VTPSRITELPTYLRVEIGTGGPSEVMATYRATVITSLRKGLRRVLVTSLDFQPDEVHEAVRSSIRMLALAGPPPGHRIALVARAPSTAAIYGSTAAMAQGLGLDVRHFDTEKQALEWLEA
jgi:hypothetical protein